MVNFKRFRAPILAVTLFAIGAPAMAMSMSVIGSNQEAKDCYQAAKFQRNTSKAIESCNMAIGNTLLSSKDRAAVLVNRGILKRLDDDVQGAFNDYKAALKIIPDLPEARANRANIYYISGYFEKALADYDFALEKNVGDEGAVSLNRALVLAEMGRIGEARSGLLDVVARYPDWALAQEKLTRFTARHG